MELDNRNSALSQTALETIIKLLEVMLCLMNKIPASHSIETVRKMTEEELKSNPLLNLVFQRGWDACLAFINSAPLTPTPPPAKIQRTSDMVAAGSNSFPNLDNRAMQGADKIAVKELSSAPKTYSLPEESTVINPTPTGKTLPALLNLSEAKLLSTQGMNYRPPKIVVNNPSTSEKIFGTLMSRVTDLVMKIKEAEIVEEAKLLDEAKIAKKYKKRELRKKKLLKKKARKAATLNQEILAQYTDPSLHDSSTTNPNLTLKSMEPIEVNLPTIQVPATPLSSGNLK